MNEAASTWALVVGINRYDSPEIGAPLRGAVADARAAVEWLRRLGVPDGQILLHAVPLADAGAGLGSLALAADRADMAAVASSLGRLELVPDGSRLFVVLAGHGLYEPAGGSVFLTQEAGQRVGRRQHWTNLGLAWLRRYLLSLPFRRQYLIVDACQNYPYADTVRPLIVPGRPDASVPDPIPDPNNALVACYAAGQTQRAVELRATGRGAFLNRFLEALDPDRPFPGAVSYDFSTGQRALDLALALRRVQETVQLDVQRDDPNLLQTPDFLPDGAGRPDRTLICRLSDLPTSEVEVSIEPPDAVPAIRHVKLWVRDPVDPAREWSRLVPPAAGDPWHPPIKNRVPKRMLADAVCSVEPSAPWDVVEERHSFPTDDDRPIVFRLDPQAPPPPPPPGGPPGTGTEYLKVQAVDRDGSVLNFIPFLNYSRIADALGLPDPVEVADGVRLQRHESGPVFEVAPGQLTRGAELAAQWADELSRNASSEYTVSSVLRGWAAPELPPNVVLRPARGGATALAGALANRPVVAVDPPSLARPQPLWRTGGRWSLRDLEVDPAIRVEPGPAEVRLDLPWGTWTHRLSAPLGGQVEVRLPGTVGVPPLRVELHAEEPGGGGRVLGTVGKPPAGGIRHGLLAPSRAPSPFLEGSSRSLEDRGRAIMREAQSSPFDEGRPRSGRGQGRAVWEVRVVLPEGAPLGAWIAELDAWRRARFPLHPDRALAVASRRRSLRVEPLSDLALPEWDLLIGAGRLDALTPEAAAALANPSGPAARDPVLRLAAAYAVYAAGDWERLAGLFGSEEEMHTAPDADLLRIAADRGMAADRHGNAQPLSAGALDRLRPRAERGDVPVLRWGVRLALDLLASVDEDPILRRWSAGLDVVARNLSPASVWTAWTERGPAGRRRRTPN